MAQRDSPSASTVPGLTHCSLPTTAEEETEAPSVRAGQGHPPEPLCPFRRRVLPPIASSPGSASTRGWVGGRPGASVAQTRPCLRAVSRFGLRLLEQNPTDGGLGQQTLLPYLPGG